MPTYRIFGSALLASLFWAGAAGVAGSAPEEIHAIVEMSEHCLIGGVQNQKWVASDRFQKTMKGSGKFMLYTLKGPAGEVTLSRSAENECHDTWTRKTGPDLKAGVAIQSASWNVMPRRPQAIDAKDPAYVQLVSDILKHEGIAKPDVRISQAYKVDLDGDGKDETVIVANRYAHGFLELSGIANETAAGDYTLVFVRKTIGDKAQNIFLVKAVWAKGNENVLPRANHLSAIADLNGDGAMELVFYDAYHEGSGSVVIEIKETHAATVLDCSCEN